MPAKKVVINKRAVASIISKSNVTKKKALNLIQNKVQLAKFQFIEEFDENQVTREIEAGPSVSSNILPSSYGNLYSFLGFSKNPIPELRQLLLDNIKIVNNSIQAKNILKDGSFFYSVKINVPNVKDIAPFFPLEWGGGRSWITAIEKGVNGFGFYLFSRKGTFKNSRSGKAIQIKNFLRGDELIEQPYLTPLVRRLKNRIGFKRDF